MDLARAYCKDCGWEGQIDSEDIGHHETYCPICQSLRICKVTKNNEHFMEQKEMQDIINIDNLSSEITEYGDYEIWSKIESIKDPKQRTYQRKMFFLAGGKLK